MLATVQTDGWQRWIMRLVQPEYGDIFHTAQSSYNTAQGNSEVCNAMLLPVIRTAQAGLLEAISFITSPEHLTFSQRPNIAKTLVGGHYYSSFVTC